MGFSVISAPTLHDSKCLKQRARGSLGLPEVDAPRACVGEAQQQPERRSSACGQARCFKKREGTLCRAQQKLT
jgi:hypothetical protein